MQRVSSLNLLTPTSVGIPPEDPPADRCWLEGFMVYPIMLLLVSPYCKTVSLVFGKLSHLDEDLPKAIEQDLSEFNVSLRITCHDKRYAL